MTLKEITLDESFKKKICIDKIKSGDITFVVSIEEGSALVVKNKGEKAESVKVFIPEVAVSTLSSFKRKGNVTRTPLDNESRLKAKVRDAFSRSNSRMFTGLDADESDKFKTKDALLEIKKSITKYLDKEKPQFIAFQAYSDNRDKRNKFYNSFLNRNKYTPVTDINSGNWKIYSNNNTSFYKVVRVDMPSRTGNPVKDLFRTYVKNL